MDSFSWQLSNQLNSKLQSQIFTSQEFDNVCEEIFDQLDDQEFAALILPTEKSLEKSHPCFLKNCEKINQL